MIGIEPCDNGASQLEINESKVININNEISWMFGICYRVQYDICIFFINNNRTHDSLIPIIINNEYTTPYIIYNNRDENKNVSATRIFSNCSSAYQESFFNRNEFILHKINHSISFVYCSLNTNSIEGFLSKMKCLTFIFSGLNGIIFNINRDINDLNFSVDGFVLGYFICVVTL